MHVQTQLALFATPFFMPEETLPGGFTYQEDFITAEEETALLATFQSLAFTHAKHQGYEAHRRIIGYGWHNSTMPEFLIPLRNRAAAFAGIANPENVDTALISEYTPGSAIGWHRDKPTVGHIIGISLGNRCQFRLRKQQGANWQRFAVTAQPRSIYCMKGESRTHWQHSIPPVEALRYSITFRDF